MLVAKDGRMSKQETYMVNVRDTESAQAWMSSPAVGSLVAGLQDGGRCLFTVTTHDGPALERALDVDEDVIEYRRQATSRS